MLSPKRRRPLSSRKVLTEGTFRRATSVRAALREQRTPTATTKGSRPTRAVAVVTAMLAVASCSPNPPPAPAAGCPTASAKTLKDLRTVVGVNSAVFVAKIAAHESVRDGVFGPVDTYRAEASNPLMGSAIGSVLIEAGTELRDGKPCRYGVPLPEVGKSYLVAASYDKARQVFVTGEGQAGLSVLSDAEIAKIGTPEEPVSVKDMREAIKSPIHPTI